MDKLNDSFTSVFEDRLVVESYIYLLSDHLYQKKLAVDNCSKLTGNNYCSQVEAHNEAITGLIASYEQTLLTEEEEACLQDFKANLLALQNLEAQFLSQGSDKAYSMASQSRFNDYFALASTNLRQLSQIQINEGKALTDSSHRIVQTSSLLTSIEMVTLIGIAIILQIIVLASRPVINKNWQQSNLN